MDTSSPGNKNPPVGSADTSVKFLHTKASHFRCIHADGAWGLIGAGGNLHFLFFNERPPLETTVTQEITAEGKWSSKQPITEMESEANAVRNFEVEIIMSIEVAKVAQAVLQSFIALSEKATQEETRKK
jgi:hypothetical protein